MVKTSYTSPSKEFFSERKLKRHAGVWQLWALGVGAVISGDFFGWNFGLASGGYGGMLLALLALPLFVPVLIFGAGAAEAQAAGLSPAPHLSLLGAGLIVAALGVPPAASLAVRIALD